MSETTVIDYQGVRLAPLLDKYNKQFQEQKESINKLEGEIAKITIEIEQLLQEKEGIPYKIARAHEKRKLLALQVERQRLRKTFFAILKTYLVVTENQSDTQMETRLEIALSEIEKAIATWEARKNKIDETVNYYEQDILNKKVDIIKHKTNQEVIASTLQKIQETFSIFDSLLHLSSISLGENNRETQATQIIEKLMRYMELLSEKIKNYDRRLNEKEQIEKRKDEEELDGFKSYMGKLFERLFSSPKWVVVQIQSKPDFISLSGGGTWMRSVEDKQKNDLSALVQNTLCSFLENYTEHKVVCDVLIQNDMIDPLCSLNNKSRDDYKDNCKKIKPVLQRYPFIESILDEYYAEQINFFICAIETYMNQYTYPKTQRNMIPALEFFKSILPDGLYKNIWERITKVTEADQRKINGYENNLKGVDPTTRDNITVTRLANDMITGDYSWLMFKLALEGDTTELYKKGMKIFTKFRNNSIFRVSALSIKASDLANSMNGFAKNQRLKIITLLPSFERDIPDNA